MKLCLTHLLKEDKATPAGVLGAIGLVDEVSEAEKIDLSWLHEDEVIDLSWLDEVEDLRLDQETHNEHGDITTITRH